MKKAEIICLALVWICFLGCFKSLPERSNPFEPTGSKNGDPYNLQTQSFYGEIKLKWISPSNVPNQSFVIYRNRIHRNSDPNSAQVDSFVAVSQTAYSDRAVFFDADTSFVYRVSVYKGERSPAILARPYRAPKIEGNIRMNGGFNFIKGIRSKVNPNWMYALDNEQQTVQVVDLSSNKLNQDELGFVANKTIFDYAIVESGGVEYILSISQTDNSLNSCKVENNNIQRLAAKIMSLAYAPDAIASAGANDRFIFVATSVGADSFKILKIDYLIPEISFSKNFSGKSISFMLYREKVGMNRLFLLSETSSKVYMLDENLNELGSATVGKAPKNIAVCPNRDLLFVACEEDAQIYTVEIQSNSLKAHQLPINNKSNEKYSWVECAEGEESDVLFYYLVYDKNCVCTVRVDVGRTFTGMNDAEIVQSLRISGESVIMASLSYIPEIDPAKPLRNLYVFYRNGVRYFTPK